MIETPIPSLPGPFNLLYAILRVEKLADECNVVLYDPRPDKAV